MPSRSTLLLLVVTSIAFRAIAQEPSPTATLSTGTQLVILDVVATDKEKGPVHHLSASDFTVLENNIPQHVKSFEEHTAAGGSTGITEHPHALPAGVFTNEAPVSSNATLNVLLLDTLNTPVTAQSYVRDQLRLYLRSSATDAPMAIFGLSSRLYLLQSFTDDPQLLRAAVDQKPIKASPLPDHPVAGGTAETLSGKADQIAASSMSQASAAAMAEVVANLKQFEAQQSSVELQMRTRYTLDGLNQLARYLAGLPGRKNLIWFSGSFPISILPDDSIPVSFAMMADVSHEFRQTIDLLTRSQVAVYPVDARGLAVPAFADPSEPGSKYDDPRHPNAFGNDLSKSVVQTADEHETMRQMAEETGGYAFLNTNSLVQAVKSSVSAGSNYYTLTYSPTDASKDGKFRKIQVTLSRPGETLGYRRGYYAESPKLHNASATVADPMHAVMLFGSPSATQITLKVRIRPADVELSGAVAAGNIVNPSAHVSGPYRRYAVDIAADTNAILFRPSADGSRQASLQFRTYVYSADGVLINAASNKAEANLTPALYDRVLRSGISLRQVISVPAKGDYYLRIGVHDMLADREGALEAPVDSVKDLAPGAPGPAISQ